MENLKLNEVDPLDMLFRARWNIPKAAKALGISDDECKELFRSYCRERLQNES
jgi:hypothetical protein